MKKSPLNHCDSEMMHSGGWGQVRKYNSPGTTGNKEAITHNKKIMSKIGTFNMPHSPLNKGHEVNKDSIASAKAWKAHKAEYLKKEGGQEEYDREKGEFFYSPKHKKLRLIPTDDGEVQDRSGIERWQLAPDRKSSMENPFKINRKHDVDKAPDRPMADIQKTYGDNIEYAQGKLSGDILKSYIEEEDAMLKDWRTRKAKDAAASPLNQESEADKRRRERAEDEPGETQFFYNKKPKPLNEAKKEEQVYNMTPDATPEESKAVRDKFDATYMKGRGPFLKSRCWEGYEPTPGVKAYEPGSCRKK